MQKLNQDENYGANLIEDSDATPRLPKPSPNNQTVPNQ